MSEQITQQEIKPRKERMKKAEVQAFTEWMSQEDRVNLKTKDIHEMYTQAELTSNFIRTIKRKLRN